MKLVARPAKYPANRDDLATVVNSLRRIVRAIRVSSRAAEDTLGVSGAQLFVLQQLSEHPAASLSELAALTLTDQSSVSVVVSRLVARRFVVRRTSAADGRRAELSLSASGRALLGRTPEVAQARLFATLSNVGDRELRVTAQVLDTVARAMGGDDEPPSMFFEGDAASPEKTPKRPRTAGRSAR